MTQLNEITRHRKHLQHCIMQAVVITHQIADAREALKRTEDTIVNEIWNDPAYKNDKARNEQKHLARINDARYISGQDHIRQLELQKADLHGMALVTQNELTISTLLLEAELLGRRDARFILAQNLVETAGADTVKELDIKQQAGTQLLEEPVVNTRITDYQGKFINQEDKDKCFKGLIDEDTLAMPDQPKSLREQLAANMSAEKIAELTADQPEAVPVVKTQAQIEREEMENAPYFSSHPAAHTKEYKDKKKKEDEERESYGGIRI